MISGFTTYSVFEVLNLYLLLEFFSEEKIKDYTVYKIDSIQLIIFKNSLKIYYKSENLILIFSF